MKEYKGHDISFDERVEEWYCENLRDKSYKNLCVKIDQALKAEWTRTDAYCTSGYSNNILHEVEVTSISVGRHEAWVVYKHDNTRGKVNVNSLYEKTEESAAIFDNIDTNDEAIKMLNAEIAELRKQLKPLRV